MMAVSKLILFLFILSVGKSPDALRELAQIKGEWIVVSGEIHGEKIPAEALVKTVIFLSASELKKQPRSSLAFHGRLDAGHTPRLMTLETAFVTMEKLPQKERPKASKGQSLPHEQPVAPIEEPIKSFAIYRIAGDTMKLLVKPTASLTAAPPTEFVTTKEGPEFLLELRRKPVIPKRVKN